MVVKAHEVWNNRIHQIGGRMGPGRHGEVTTAANRIPAGHVLDVPPWPAPCYLPWKPCVEMSTTLVLQMRTWGRLGGFPVALSEEAGGGGEQQRWVLSVPPSPTGHTPSPWEP